MSEPAPKPSAQASKPTLAAAVRATALVTLGSRVGGLVRDVLIARIFGDQAAVGSAFAAAFAIPNMFRRLFGEGALSAAFIPEYTSLLKGDQARTREQQAADPPGESGRLASLTLVVLGLVTTAITMLAEAVLLILLLVLPHDAERALSLRLIMVMLPFMPLICSVAILAGMLQVHGRFGPAATGPLVLNAFIIAVGAWFVFTDDTAGPVVAYALGIATVLSGVTQLIWFRRLLRPHVRFTRRCSAARPQARAMFRRFVPVVIGMGTLQLNTFIDTLIAMWPIWVGPTMLGMAYPLDEASNLIVSVTSRLYQFPLGVFGIAVASAAFPLLARHADDPARFVQTLRRGLRLSLFIGLPATLGLIAVRHDLTGVLFGSGRKAFDEEALARSAAVLMGFAPGVWAYSLNHVLTRGFYARKDTATPMKIAIASMIVNLALNFTLIWVNGLREAGMAWATSLAAMFQCGLLAWATRRSAAGKPVLDGAAIAAMVRVAIASAVMFGAAWAVGQFWGDRLGNGWTAQVIRLGIVCATGMVVYVAACLASGAPELRWLLARGSRSDDQE